MLGRPDPYGRLRRTRALDDRLDIRVSSTQGRSRPDGQAFSHEALFYSGADEFTTQVSRFVVEGLERNEPVMVMAGAAKLALLREALGRDADALRLVDMETVGRNPACIIPAWAAFFEEYAESGTSPRGVGEPIWPRRTPAELIECQLHEALIDLAFAGWSGRLVCPYDTDALEPAAVGEARRSHPLLLAEAAVGVNPACVEMPWLHERFSAPLPEPTTHFQQLHFSSTNLAAVRELVALAASGFGLDRGRTDDLALATHELATNSLRHAGGTGRLRVWHEEATVICEIEDAGHIGDPLAGRVRPPAGSEGGRGLLMAYHLSDLTQIRSGPGRTVVRLHARIRNRQ